MLPACNNLIIGPMLWRRGRGASQAAEAQNLCSTIRDTKCPCLSRFSLDHPRFLNLDFRSYGRTPPAGVMWGIPNFRIDETDHLLVVCTIYLYHYTFVELLANCKFILSDLPASWRFNLLAIL